MSDSSYIVAWLLAIGFQTTLVLGGGLLILRFMRSPLARCLVARATVLTTFLGLVFSLLMMGRAPAVLPIVIRDEQRVQETEKQGFPLKQLKPMASMAPAVSSEPSLAFPSAPSVSPALPQLAKPQLQTPSAAPETAPAEVSAPSFQISSLSFTQGAVLVWIIGTIAQFVWLLVGCFSLWRMRHQATIIERNDSLELLGKLCHASHLPVPTLLESAKATSPFLFGLVRPAIVLPTQFLTRFGHDATGTVLSHELAHLSRRDLNWQIAARLVCLLLWPQPLVWLVRRELERAQEDACDQAVLQKGYSPQGYARCLLDLAEKLPLRPAYPMLGVPMLGVGIAPTRSQLRRRVQQVLQAPREVKKLTWKTQAIAGIGAFCGAVVPVGLVGAPSMQKVFTQPDILNNDNQPLSLAYAPNGKWLACGFDGGVIQIYEAATHKMVASVRLSHQQNFSLSWSPDSQRLINSHGDMLDLENKQSPLGESNRLGLIGTLPVIPLKISAAIRPFNVDVAFSPDGNSVMSGGGYRSVFHRSGAGEAWTPTWREVAKDWINEIAWSPDGSLLVEAGFNHLTFWDGTYLKNKGALRPANVRWAPEIEKGFLAQTGFKFLPSSNVKTRAQQRKMMATLMESSARFQPQGVIRDLAWSPDGQRLAIGYAGYNDGNTRINGEVTIYQIKEGISFQSENSPVATAVIPVRNKTIVRRFRMANASAMALAWSPDGRYIAAGEGELGGFRQRSQERDILIWDVTTGSQVQALNGNNDQINSLAWSKDGKTLVSASSDKTVRFWPIANEEPRLATWEWPANGDPATAVRSFYAALNSRNEMDASALLYARPIGGVDMSGLRQTLQELKQGHIKVALEDVNVMVDGDEASAQFRVEFVSGTAPRSFTRLALGKVRVELRQGKNGWQLREEPLPDVDNNAEIVGRVVDENGRPMAGIAVGATLYGDDRKKLPGRADIKALHLAPAMRLRLINRLLNSHDWSRADGTFRLPGLTSGTYVVQTQASLTVSPEGAGLPPGYTTSLRHPVKLKSGQRFNGVAVQLELQRGTTVRGRVVDAQTLKPVKGITLGITHTHMVQVRPSVSQPFTSIIPVESDSAGKFTAGVKAGEVGVYLIEGGNRPDSGFRSKRDIQFIIDGVKRTNSTWPKMTGKAGQIFTVEVRIGKASPQANLQENKKLFLIGSRKPTPLDPKTLQNLRLSAGLTPMYGPGVVVEVRDRFETVRMEPSGVSRGLVHDYDLLAVVNELFAARAEGVAINGVRVGGNTAIRAVGPNIQVAGKIVNNPFKIEAIGNPEWMLKTLAVKGGFTNGLQQNGGLGVKIRTAKELKLPAFKDVPTLRYGRSE